MSSRLRNLNPYELHKYLVNIYCLNSKGSTELLKRDQSKDRTYLDVIRENHKFLWDDDDDANTWEEQLAKQYYDKLFKEYCICDLTRYKDNKVALRWRVEKEVVMGKGQFQCGSKHCNGDTDLKSWEVNFAYKEDNERKNALVKIRLCPECSTKLNYKSKKREVKRLKKSKKRKRTSKSIADDEEEKTPPPLPDTNDLSPSAPTTSGQQTSASDDTELWKKGIPETEEKSREEEFEEYLEDLLL